MKTSKILVASFALLVIGLSACLDRPRNGQFLPGGISAPVDFVGYLREPGLPVQIFAFLPYPQTGSAVIAVATCAILFKLKKAPEPLVILGAGIIGWLLRR